MENKRQTSEACFECWFYKDGSCEYIQKTDGIKSDITKSPKERSRLISDIREELIGRDCPNIDAIAPEEK